MNPLVSIIIPTFNRAHLISETLESIISLTYQNWECILVDDGSSDNTKDLLEKYVLYDTRIKFYTRPNELTKGQNSCRNYGYYKSTGNWIKWFDSDDLFLPSALDFMANLADSEYDVYITNLLIVDGITDKIINNKKSFSDNLITDYLIGKIAFYVCGPTWKKSFLEKQTYLFDDNLSNLDDWDFNLRMIYNNPNIYYLDESLIKYRVYSNSLSHEIDKLNINEIKSEFKAREKHMVLLKKINKPAKSLLVNFTKKRYKYFFREALIKNHYSKFYFLNKLFIYQMKTLDLFGILKTLFAFLIFKIFNKGYKLLK
ncbi:glycosyltransferase family 2 protein [Flavobacterium sp.]|uniref:glycosyltransferase family 2 protein n=1 Tax=Flavobacterium sp. TaxID=239 RepID=UPI003BEB5F0C